MVVINGQDSARLFAVNEIYSVFDHGPKTPETWLEPFHNGLFDAVRKALAPQSLHIAPFGVIEVAPIGRFECGEAAQARDLLGGPSRSPHAPHLEGARAI